MIDLVNNENLIVMTHGEITMYKLWRKSSIEWLPEVHGHGFEGQNELLNKEEYCFGCFQPMKPKYNAKTFDKRLNCRTCSGGHPTAVHSYIRNRKENTQDDQRSNENDESGTNSFANLKTLSTVEKHQTKVISMCIVPVKVKSAAQGKNVLTYAMLENCSQESFIQEALVKKIQEPGRKTTLNLKTLNEERSESTTAIEGLQIARSKDGSTWIKMPRIYTRKHLAVNKSKVATLQKIKEWNYLKTISSEITQTDNVEVGMLIGANCTKALECLKVIASNSRGPNHSSKWGSSPPSPLF